MKQEYLKYDSWINFQIIKKCLQFNNYLPTSVKRFFHLTKY